MNPFLYWHCPKCGHSEGAQPEYDRGDWEKCECGGKAYVMRLDEGARIEAMHARGAPMTTEEIVKMLDDKETSE